MTIVEKGLCGVLYFTQAFIQAAIGCYKNNVPKGTDKCVAVQPK